MDSINENTLKEKLAEIYNILSVDDTDDLLGNLEKWRSKRISCIAAFEEILREFPLNDMENETGFDIGGNPFESTENTDATSKNCLSYKQKIENAKTILVEDISFTNKLTSFLRKAEELEKLFICVFDCSIKVNSTLISILTVLDQMWAISQNESEDVVEVWEKIFADSEIKSDGENKATCAGESLSDITPETKRVFSKFCNNKESIESVLKIQEIVKKLPLRIEIPRLFLSLTVSLENAVQNVELFSSLVSTAKKLNYTITYNGCFTNLTVNNFGMDLVALLSLMNDLSANASEFSEFLWETIKLLKAELECVTETYRLIQQKLLICLMYYVNVR